MNELIIAIIAFAAGYVCGFITKHELWVWVKKHGSKDTKKNH